ncbi:MAG TPA: hypothetical protein VEL07_17185 [Planctomycetota bacterium]|nr:hypothetical protein [Planctomycetota bacterium]
MRAALLLLLAAAASAADGVVQFSDGREIVGAVRLAQDLKIHDGDMRTLAVDLVREIRCEPAAEELVRQFRFPEAGKTTREEHGEPYPVRRLRAIVALADGSEVRGTLATTVLFVTPTGDDQAERVILASKQQGEPGAALASLVYAARIVVTPGETAAAGASFALPGADAAAEVVVLAPGSLARVAARRVEDAWRLPMPLATPAFVCTRCGDGAISVAWPAGDDAAARAAIGPAVTEAKDFLDDRRLIAAYAPTGDEIYGLLLLYRAGSSTLDGAARPWRVEVWRWKRDPADGRLMWAGRGYAFRGNVDDPALLPPVRIEPAWWTEAR